MDDVIELILKDFGPAGGFAIILLGASLWVNWKLVSRITHQGDAISACRADCEKEKLVYRDVLDKRYQEAVAVFLTRDNQKREDLDNMFRRFENLVEVVSDGLTKVTTANDALRYELKGRRGSQS